MGFSSDERREVQNLEWFRTELNDAINWADECLRDVCNLTDGKDAGFKSRLKAMVFDGCLRLIAFQYARSRNIKNWPYHPDDVAISFGWSKAIE